jgi:hypothetical protein
MMLTWAANQAIFLESSAARRSAIQTLMIDCRVTPNRSASWSIFWIIQVGICKKEKPGQDWPGLSQIELL